MNRMAKVLILWFVTGMLYYTLEGVWRIPTNGGNANIVMLPIGGLCGVLIGSINQIPAFYKMKVVLQTLIGTFTVLAVEYVTGYILNIRMGLGIWDYSNMPYNLNGQICGLYALLWFLLIPVAIWLEDYLRYRLWNEGSYYSLPHLYVELVTCK